MIKTAYNETWLYNLAVVKETKRWLKHELISDDQFKAIEVAYPGSLYHPNFIIRILLFIVSLLAIGGVTLILGLIVADMGSDVYIIASMFYGVASFLFLEGVFIKGQHHYKSGVNEALLYHALGFFLGGFIALEMNIHFTIIVVCIVLTLAAVRYLDLICTLCAIASFAGFLFYELYTLGGILQALIPFAFIIVFIPIYLMVKSAKEKETLKLWYNNLLLLEAVSLLLVYLGGNYLVVRELSVNMMNLYLEEGQDIPYAMVFYILTVITPVLYLYRGIKKKDKVLIRFSLVLLALSILTFKYYFSLGHPEISLTIAGIILLLITLWLLHYLKVMRNGFTRENLLSEKWGEANAEAFIISQTLGGNQINAPDQVDTGGGGQFGGGGSTDSFFKNGLDPKHIDYRAISFLLITSYYFRDMISVVE